MVYEPFCISSFQSVKVIVLLTCSLSDNCLRDDGVEVLVEALLVNCKDIKDVK